MSMYFRRVASLAAFLRSERRHRKIRPTELFDLELAVIASIIVITVLLYLAPLAASVFLYLFLLPVTASAFYLGRQRAGVAATLCILATLLVFFGCEWSVTPYELATWGAVLVLSSLSVGTLSDELYGRFKRVYDSHLEETRTDALTNVSNRRSFDYEIERRLKVTRDTGEPFCLAIIDIDHFKRLNDIYGHQAGDKMLHDVARSLEATVRSQDIVARYGGEEFVIIMPNTSLEDGSAIVEQVRADIEATRFFFKRVKMRLKVSAGVTEVYADDDAESAICRADDALYTSKRAGRNCIHVHTGTNCEAVGQSTFLAPQAQIEFADMGAEELPQPVLLDPMTKLPSRDVFTSELVRRVSESQRYGCELSIALVRIEPLANLARQGKCVHTRASNIVGELIRGVMRETDLLARYSEDTFAVLMPFTNSSQAILGLDRLAEEIASCETLRQKGSVVKLCCRYSICDSAEGDTAAGLLGGLLENLETTGSVRPMTMSGS